MFLDGLAIGAQGAFATGEGVAEHGSVDSGEVEVCGEDAGFVKRVECIDRILMTKNLNDRSNFWFGRINCP